MPAITSNSRQSFGAEALTVIDSDGADSLVYVNNSNQVLQITNNTAGALSLNIIGSTAPADYRCGGTGTTEDLTGGYPVAVPVGDSVKINLSSISAWLSGDITITGGSTGTLYTLMQN